MKFLWHFKEADGRADFSIVNNTELPTRARARVGSSVLSTIEKSPCNSKKLNLKFLWPFKEAYGRADFSIVNNTKLPTRARARVTMVTVRSRARGGFCIVYNRKVGASVGLLKRPQKNSNSVFRITWRLFYCGQYRNPHARARSWGVL